jgi:GNAT superfamily N-acetyltransferase
VDADGMVIEQRPELKDVADLHRRLYEANVAATGVGDGADLAIFMRDDTGQVRAGLEGWTWGGCLFVRNLWVREDLRGAGHGTRLVRAAESEAIRRGCRKVMLETDSFQAPAFYRGLGYELIAEVQGILGDTTRLHFRKWLPAGP